MSRVVALSPHHQRFVDCYMEHRVAARAAVQAGYGASAGGNILARDDVRREIQRRLALIQEQVEITEARIAREMAHVAYVDPGDMFDDDGRLLSIKKMPAHMRRAIASVEVDALYEGHGDQRMQVGTTTKIKLWPKVQALEGLAKYKGMFIERHQHTGQITYVIEVPTPIHDPLVWAKSVQARILATEKEAPCPSNPAP